MNPHRVAFVAPSGWPAEADALDRAARYFARRGYSVEADDAVFERFERFAGDDVARAAALTHVALESQATLVMAVRGGYGLTRLLDMLDWRAIGRAVNDTGKVFVGHSDFTVFNLALLAQGKAPSFAGPVACFDFGATTISAFTQKHFWSVMSEPMHELIVRAARQPRVMCEGTLWGGNLAIVASLVGTRWMPKVDGGILFLEDVNEHPYRVERMLYQLHHAGVLPRQRAVLLGDFSGYVLGANDNGYTFDTMVARVREFTDVPILGGLPFGHCRDKVTLPVGGHACIEPTRGGWRLELSDYPVLG